MPSIRNTITHVRAQPVRVRVAVLIVLTATLFILGFLLVALVIDLGFLGALAILGFCGAVVLMLWACVTICSSNL